MIETPTNSIDCKELYVRLSAVNLGNILPERLMYLRYIQLGLQNEQLFIIF